MFPIEYKSRQLAASNERYRHPIGGRAHNVSILVPAGQEYVLFNNDTRLTSHFIHMCRTTEQL